MLLAGSGVVDDVPDGTANVTTDAGACGGGADCATTRAGFAGELIAGGASFATHSPSAVQRSAAPHPGLHAERQAPATHEKPLRQLGAQMPALSAEAWVAVGADCADATDAERDEGENRRR